MSTDNGKFRETNRETNSPHLDATSRLRWWRRSTNASSTSPSGDDPTQRLSRHRDAALRGAGSVQEIRPGVWKVTIATASGRRARTIHGTRADAYTALDRLHEENDGPVASLNALAARYLAHAAASDRAPNTIRRYRELWRDWLAPTLGATRPDELHPAQIEATLTAMADHGLSASSIRQAASLLARAYRWAQDTGLANYNPVLASRLPDGARITIRRR